MKIVFKAFLGDYSNILTSKETSHMILYMGRWTQNPQ